MFLFRSLNPWNSLHSICSKQRLGLQLLFVLSKSHRCSLAVVGRFLYFNYLQVFYLKGYSYTTPKKDRTKELLAMIIIFTNVNIPVYSEWDVIAVVGRFFYTFAIFKQVFYLKGYSSITPKKDRMKEFLAMIIFNGIYFSIATQLCVL